MNYSRYPDFVKETINLNRTIYSIIEDKRAGNDVTSEIASFFEIIEKLKINIDRFYNIKILEITHINTVIELDRLENNTLYRTFIDSINKINDELKVAFKDESGRYPSLHWDTLRPNKFVILTNHNQHLEDKITNSDIYKRAVNLLQTYLIEKAAIEDRIKVRNNNITELKQDLQYINIMKSILNAPKLLDYCNELFDNYNDVIFLKNDNSRIKQATILQFDLVYMSSFVAMSYFYGGHSISIKDVHPDFNFNTSPNIFDIFDEDEEYYYGIYNNKKVRTLKTNCRDQNPIIAVPSLDYIVINDKIINEILNIDVNIFDKKCKLLLFEYPVGWFVTKNHFLMESDIQNICGSTVDDRCPFETRDRIINKLRHEPFPNNINLFDFYKNKFFANSHTPNHSVIKSLFIDNYIKLLKKLNTSNKIKSIVNLRCILTRNEEDKKQLHNNIEDILNYDDTKAPSDFWERMRYENDIQNKRDKTITKLLYFYFEEIKLLLLHYFMHKRGFVNFRNSWNYYLTQNNLPNETTPGSCLNYLLNDVFNINQYTIDYMLSKIGVDTEVLIDKLQLTEPLLIYNIFKKQIEGIISIKSMQQVAGLSGHKSKLSKRKYKTGKKQLEYNQKISRKHKINRKQQISRKQKISRKQ